MEQNSPPTIEDAHAVYLVIPLFLVLTCWCFLRNYYLVVTTYLSLTILLLTSHLLLSYYLLPTYYLITYHLLSHYLPLTILLAFTNLLRDTCCLILSTWHITYDLTLNTNFSRHDTTYDLHFLLTLPHPPLLSSALTLLLSSFLTSLFLCPPHTYYLLCDTTWHYLHTARHFSLTIWR